MFSLLTAEFHSHFFLSEYSELAASKPPPPPAAEEPAEDANKAVEEEQKVGVEDLEVEDLKPIAGGSPVHWPWCPLPAGMSTDDALACLGEVSWRLELPYPPLLCQLSVLQKNFPLADAQFGGVYEQLWDAAELRDRPPFW